MTRSDTLTSTVSCHLKSFCADESGATSIEYAMIASGIGVVICTVVVTLGGKVKGLFTLVSNMFS